MREFDLFISHSSSDKKSVVEPLTQALQRKGLKVWVDHDVIQSGQTIRDQINKGISSSRFVLVVLSPDSIKSRWVKEEINTAFQRFGDDLDSIIPVIHNITLDELARFDLMLASRSTLRTDRGIDFIADKIADKCGPNLDAKQTAADKSIVIGISGPSCAGKSWFARKISARLPSASRLFDLDSYYKDLDVVNALPCRHDNPESVDLTEASVDLEILKRGSQVEVPDYNFELHQRAGSKIVYPAPFIIVEGIFCFANPRLRRLIDIKIWIDAYSDLRYERRIGRDTKERGRDVEEVINRYSTEVQPGYSQFIEPLKKYADVCVENNLRDKDHNPLFVEMLVSYLVNIKASPEEARTVRR